MPQPLSLSNLEARRFLLARQGLWPPRALSGKDGVMAVFDRLGCIQFDPLNIIARNPDLVLQSRVADYRPQMLYELMYLERRLYDYWDKMMSVVPVRDWPNLALQRARWREHHSQRLAECAEHVQTVLTVIAEQGPMSSLDFEAHHNVDWKTDWRWGSMRAAKVFLEMLSDTGDLVVSHRQEARRYYDLAERVLPREVTQRPLLTDERAYLRWRVARRCQGIGLMGPAMGSEVWAGVAKEPERTALVRELVEQGEIVPVKVEQNERVFHLLARDTGFLEQAADAIPPFRMAFIAPLDNLLWSRNLIEWLFGFRYLWEVYKPAEQRRYGYYVLPVLYGDRFVARFDSKVDRDNRILRVLSWRWEAGESLTDELTPSLCEALSCFVSFLGVEAVEVAEGVDPSIAACVRAVPACL